MLPEKQPPVVQTKKPRQGFLPFKNNAFDRGFISVVCLIAIHLFWMRYVESFLPIGIATVISIIWSYILFRYG
jgi:predicted small integral membrane protein